MEPNLSQALHLLNGDTLAEKIRSGGVINKMLDAKVPLEKIVEDLYLRTLTRPPTDKERQGLLAILKDEPDPQAALEDAFWAILNSREFVFNH